LNINGVIYRIAEHPAAPGIPHGQEGRAGIVFHLLPPSAGGGSGVDEQALKVFKPRFRLPYLVSQAEKLAAYADLPGLQAARRIVLTPTRHADLLHQHSDLTYAALMPWIVGPTWLETILEKKPFTAEQSLALARDLVETPVRMEERGLAHCDLSSPNVMLPALAGGGGIALIDLEGFYAPGMIQPQALSSGSAGYAHRQAGSGLWSPEADRFAGAVLLAEMLGWCDPQVCQEAWGESFFDPKEVQDDVPRYQTLIKSLRSRWGDGMAVLFGRAWHSDSLSDCPTFGEWLVALPDISLVSETVYTEEEVKEPIESETFPQENRKVQPFPAPYNQIEPITSPLQPPPLSRGAIQMPAASQTSGLAVATLITGIAGFLIPLIGGLAAIILGHIALKKIKDCGGQTSGKELASVGLILGYINIAISIVGCGLLIIFIIFSYLIQTGYFSF